MRIAFITGITGQDGSYLAENLLEKGYIVHGLYRRSSTNCNLGNISHILSKLHLHIGDMTDCSLLTNIIHSIESTFTEEVERFEIYNLAAQSHVQRSFEMPEYTLQCDGVGILSILEIIRHSKYKNIIRIYQASTSELFGKVVEYPQTEKTPFYPRSPYGIAKLYAFWIVKNYRESYNLFAVNGILFNHESPRRGEDFVTRKITRSLGKILKNEISHLEIGNIDAKRDWGHAKDYVEVMWRMLQTNIPDDYVVSSSETHSVREFLEIAFKQKGINLLWRGTGVLEEGYENDKVYVKINSEFYRPAEVDILCGDSRKAKYELGWNPKYSFQELVQEMVEFDCS